jgi:hypothetical protein
MTGYHVFGLLLGVPIGLTMTKDGRVVLRRALALARTLAWCAWRVATGRDTLFLLDPDGEARLTINARRDR